MGINYFSTIYQSASDSRSVLGTSLLHKLAKLGGLLAELFGAWSSLVDSIARNYNLLLLRSEDIINITDKTSQLGGTLDCFKTSNYPENLAHKLIDDLTNLIHMVGRTMQNLAGYINQLQIDIQTAAMELSTKAYEKKIDQESAAYARAIIDENGLYLSKLQLLLTSSYSAPDNMDTDISPAPDIYLVDPSAVPTAPLPPPLPPTQEEVKKKTTKSDDPPPITKSSTQSITTTIATATATSTSTTMSGVSSTSQAVPLGAIVNPELLQQRRKTLIKFTKENVREKMIETSKKGGYDFAVIPINKKVGKDKEGQVNNKNNIKVQKIK